MRRRRKKRRREGLSGRCSANQAVQVGRQIGESELAAAEAPSKTRLRAIELILVIMIASHSVADALAVPRFHDPQAAWQANVIEARGSSAELAKSNGVFRPKSTLIKKLPNKEAKKPLLQQQLVSTNDHDDDDGHKIGSLNLVHKVQSRDKRQASSQDSDQVASSLATASLPVGSRVVVGQDGASVELTCNALDTPALANQMRRQLERGTTSKQQHFAIASTQQLNLVAGPNGTLAFEGPEESHLPTSGFGDPVERLFSLTGSGGGQLEASASSDSAAALRRHLNFLDANDYLVALVFWYKDDNPAPVYTLDARPITAQVLAEFESATSAGGNQASSRNSAALRNVSIAQVATEKLNQISQINRRLLAGARHYRQVASFEAAAAEEEADEDELVGDAAQRGRGQKPLVSIQSSWPLIKLRLSKVNARLAGDFKCRVDFRRARTVRQTVRLLVEARLRQLQLIKVANNNTTTSQGAQVKHAKASDQTSDSHVPSSAQPSNSSTQLRVLRLNEGAALTLECRAIGGSPRPKLSWLVERDGNATQQEILNTGNALSWGLEGLRLVDVQRASHENNWPYGASPGNWKEERAQVARPPIVWSSRLTVERLGRQAHGLRLGCRARQVLQFSWQAAVAGSNPSVGQASKRRARRVANYRPPTPQAGGGQSRGSNWIHGGRSKRNNELPGGGGGGALQPQIFELTKWLELELNVKPELVEILYANVSVARANQTPTEGTAPLASVGISLDDEAQRQPATFVCRAPGSRPPARLEWFWEHEGSQSERAGRTQTLRPLESDGHELQIRTRAAGSESELVLAGGLRAHHNRRVLACRATNELLLQEETEMADDSLWAQVRLDLKFGPLIELSATTAASPAVLPQSTDKQLGANLVALQCQVKANPAINQLVWLVNGRPLAKVALINNRTSAAAASSGNAVATWPQPRPPSAFQAAKVELFDEAEIKQFELNLEGEGGGDCGELARKAQTNFLVQHQISPERARRFQLDLGPLACLRQSADSLNVSLAFQPDDGLDQSDDKINLINWRRQGNGPARETALEFKCLATSGDERGERASKPLVLAPQLDDSKCFLERPKPQAAATHDEQEAIAQGASLLDSVRWHQVHDHRQPATSGLICHHQQSATSASDAQNSTARFLWSFVEAQDLVRASGAQLAIERTLIRRQLETNSSELQANQLPNLIKAHERGLILCQQFVALRAEWQRAPCLILMRGGGGPGRGSEPILPDVRKCSLQPVLELAAAATGSAPTSSAALGGRELPAGKAAAAARRQDNRLGKLVLNLDCEQTRGGGGEGPMIFGELSARVPQRRDPTGDKGQARDNGDGRRRDASMARAQGDGDAPPDAITAAFERRLFALFGAPANQKFHHRLELDDETLLLGLRRLPDIRHDLDYATRAGVAAAAETTTTNEAAASQMGRPNGTAARWSAERKTSEAARALLVGEAQGANEPGGDSATFAGQVAALLNELEFTLRLGDLVEPPSGELRSLHLGAQLQVQSASSRPLASGQQKAAVAQVSRSTPDEAETSPFSGDASHQGALLAARYTNTSADSPQTAITLANHAHRVSQTGRASGDVLSRLLDWGNQHEVGLTLAAIGATSVLTALTLTLLVVVLKRARTQQLAAGTNSAPPSLATTTTTTNSSNLNANHQNHHQPGSNSSPSSSSNTNSQDIFNQQTSHADQNSRNILMRLQCAPQSQFLLATANTISQAANSSVSSFSSPPPTLNNCQPLDELNNLDQSEPLCFHKQQVLDLRHFQPPQDFVQCSTNLASKQFVQLDYGGLIVMDESELTFQQQQQQVDVDYQQPQTNFLASPSGQATVLNLNLGSLQESCATTSAASASETSQATPSAIDFLAPPATSGGCGLGGSNLRLHWLQ